MNTPKTLMYMAAAASAWLTTAPALAQQAAWPTHAITLVVPFAAGGGGDTLARLVAEPLSRELGQSIIVENRPGAGGNIGTSIAARANPDGYTLSYGTNGTQATNHWLYKSPGYKPNDFEPISRFTVIAAALVVNGTDDRFKSLAQLVDYAKLHPGELTCGSAGNGTSSHLACELLNQMAGLKVMHIPYKGGSAAMTDLLGGRISFLIDVMPNVSGQIAAGKLRALAVTTPERVASNPDIPTLSEAGVKGYEFYAWDGLYAPKGTPVAVLDKLNAAVNQALRQPDVKKALESRGAIPSPTSRQSLAEFGAEEYTRLGKVVKTAGAAID